MACTIFLALLAVGACAVKEQNCHGTCEGTSGSIWLQVGGALGRLESESDEGQFIPVAGGESRACRGSSSNDNSAENYILHTAASLDDCKHRCLENELCKGIEYGSRQRCEVWIRDGGIRSSIPVSGFTCLQFAPSSIIFEPVDGGAGRACRGEDSNDNAASHYMLVVEESLDDCKLRCYQTGECKGIEYGPNGRCELWVRNAGIESFALSPLFTCMRLVRSTTTTTELAFDFQAVDGGEDRACRGSSPDDNRPSYWRLTTAGSLDSCKEQCTQSPECQGIEYSVSSSRCEIWVGAIGSSQAASGFLCLRKGGSSSGTTSVTLTSTTTTSTSTTTSTTTATTTSPPTTATTAPPTVTTSTVTTGDSSQEWTLYAGVNCYSGNGAEGVEGKDPLSGDLTEAACQDECLKDATCEGIVMPASGPADRMCWLRKNVQLASCPQNTPYNYWARPGSDLSTSVEIMPSDCCEEFSLWPDVDNGVTCGSCMALVRTEPYNGRCDQYCESFGHVCVAAAEEENEDCRVRYVKACNEEIQDTSDMLCTCRRPDVVNAGPLCTSSSTSSSASVTTSTTTVVTTNEGTTESVASVTTSTTTVITTNAGSCCDSFDMWPDVDGGVTCESCTALVLTAPYGGRCDKYCQSFGHVCTSAAEEEAENCRVKSLGRCDTAILDTSDMLCTCKKPGASCSTASFTTSMPSTGRKIEVVGRQVRVDGQPLHLKGIAWNPVPKGGLHPRDLDFAGFVERDAALMQQMGINAVRTYEPITDRTVLDILWSHGIWVLNSVYNWGGASADSVIAPVNAVKDHPSILMWTLGNEWNYNGLYVGMSFFDCIARINQAAEFIRQHDTSHPIASIYGEVSRLDEAIQSLTSIDVWSINSYRGITFGDLFDVYASISRKPMFLGEYGADAFNANIQMEDQQSQADATRQLTQEIVAASSVRQNGVCLGGFVFEFSDEWHKDSKGSPSVHDTGGIAPGGGPYPDKTFNEEWWGLVDIDRSPRLAFQAYADINFEVGLLSKAAKEHRSSHISLVG
eukprot:TRINITY_DN4608_c0_g1_i1.p1 TRINITY_DN4608_c0_g1~~TRINITY_DN4608_c0_g1_i1.p1  ORF type:complete len:1027 (-),score=162.98 TRINITY_DN4608_c0_g1_i1:267-3347(-)